MSIPSRRQVRRKSCGRPSPRPDAYCRFAPKVLTMPDCSKMPAASRGRDLAARILPCAPGRSRNSPDPTGTRSSRPRARRCIARRFPGRSARFLSNDETAACRTGVQSAYMALRPRPDIAPPSTPQQPDAASCNAAGATQFRTEEMVKPVYHDGARLPARHRFTTIGQSKHPTIHDNARAQRARRSPAVPSTTNRRRALVPGSRA